MNIQIIANPPLGKTRVGDYLVDKLNDIKKTGSFYFAVAFAQDSGINPLSSSLKKAIEKGVLIEGVIGIDVGGTSLSAIETLKSILPAGSLFIYYDPQDEIFHTKLFIVKANDKKAAIIIGSSNLTAGGLFNNLELVTSIELSLRKESDNLLYEEFLKTFIKIKESNNSKPVTSRLLSRLKRLKIFGKGELLSKKRFVKTKGREKLAKIFGAVTAPVPKDLFVMTLVPNDISGKRFEPYFLIPLEAIRTNPSFWYWPGTFSLGQGVRKEKRIELAVKAKGKTYREQPRLYFFPDRDEFRFCSKTIYTLGQKYVGSIAKIKWKNANRSKIEIITPRMMDYQNYLNIAKNSASKGKRWGYS
jgi:HKD family nuclease